MLGMVFLGERLSRLQMLAVAIAAVGVALLLAGALDTLWISLALAFSFGLYGLLRKVAPVGSLPGLAIETTLLFVTGLGIAVYYVVVGDRSEERREGNERGDTCRSRWSPFHKQKKIKTK